MCVVGVVPAAWQQKISYPDSCCCRCCCCQVVIVEEAAEVLEAHILTSMSSKTEHLILIGERLPCWYAHARVTAADSRSTDHL